MITWAASATTEARPWPERGQRSAGSRMTVTWAPMPCNQSASSRPSPSTTLTRLHPTRRRRQHPSASRVLVTSPTPQRRRDRTATGRDRPSRQPVASSRRRAARHDRCKPLRRRPVVNSSPSMEAWDLSISTLLAAGARRRRHGVTGGHRVGQQPAPPPRACDRRLQPRRRPPGLRSTG